MSKLTAQITINASKEKVWEVIADFGNVYKWTPSVVKSYYTTQATAAVGAARHCDIVGGFAVEESITGWEEGSRMDIDVEGAGPTMHVSWSVSPAGDGAVATLTVEFEMDGAEADRIALEERMRYIMDQSLAGLKYHVETGEVIGTELPEGAVATA